MDDDFFKRRVGTVLCGKWTLERLLGVGGMAAVYVGRHHIGRRDAIKMLHPSAGRSKELRARFEQEAHAVGRLAHPAVVRIDDIDVAEDGSTFLVMELLEGETIADRCKREGCVPLGDALRWADQLLDVLVAAHAMGIVHRDLKPDNVFLTSDGGVKLLDFGIAHMRDVTRESMHTATGVAIGTVPFMPPEQARGRPIDARADVFALAATVVRVVAGRNIHDAGSDAELFLKMASEPVPPVAQLAPGLGDDACAVLDHALAFDRDRRYPDAASMQSDVRALREGRRPERALAACATAAPRAVPATTYARPVATVPDARARKVPAIAWVLGGSIAIGCLLSGGALWALRGGGTPAGAREAGGAALAPVQLPPSDASSVAPGGAPGATGAAPGAARPGAAHRPAPVAPRPGDPAAPAPAAPPPAPPTTSPPPPAKPPPPATTPHPPATTPPPPAPAPPRGEDEDEDKSKKGKGKRDEDRGKKGKGKRDED